MRKIAIIGAGQAAAATALALREQGFDGQIALFGEEAHPPYERPELTKAYALGDTAFESLHILRDLEEPDLTLHLNAKVTRIDRNAKRIETAIGHFSYDLLFIATGGRAKRLPLPATLAGRAIAIRTKEDADRLRDVLQNAALITVIGGGWLGTEAAITAAKRGASVDLVEMGARLCGRVAPVWLSDEIANLQDKAGVRVHLNARPHFAENGTIAISDRILQPDLVIEAIGMTANDDLARAAGLDCQDGIMTDAQGRTADPAIFAVGDCARMTTPDGAGLRRESWQNANQSAAIAARAALGKAPITPEPDWFWTTQGNTKIQMLGTCRDGLTQIDRKGPRGGYSRVFMEGTRLHGVIAIDNPREIAEARRLLASQRPLDPLRVGDGAQLLSHCIIDHREAV